MAERGAQETSSIVVETVQKISKSKNVGPVLPLFKSDASKVTNRGMGLKKAYLGKQNQFTVSAGDAGTFYYRNHQLVQASKNLFFIIKKATHPYLLYHPKKYFQYICSMES